MELELWINLILGLLKTEHLADGDQWKEGHAVIETRVFDRIYMFPSTVVASVKGLHRRCAGKLHSLEHGTAGAAVFEATGQGASTTAE
jgi:hypothetical protein